MDKKDKDNMKKEYIREIGKDVSDTASRNLANTLQMSTYGAIDHMDDTIENVRNFRDSVAELLKRNSTGFQGDFMGQLGNYYKEDESGQGLNQFKSSLGIGRGIFNDDNVDSSLMSVAYTSYNSNIQKYKDIDLVIKMIPQLREAVDTMADSIMAADNSDSLITFKEVTEDQFNRLKSLDTNYKMYDRLSNIIKDALAFGYGYALVVPYKDAFENFKMKNDAYRRAKIIRDRTASSKEPKSISESMDVEQLLSENGVEITEDMNLDSLKESTKSFLDNIVICEGAHHLCEFETSEEVELINEAKRTENIINAKLNGTFKKDKNKVVKSDGFKATNGGFNFEDEDVTGCVFRHINTKNIIPIRVEETNIGYYYVEDMSILEGINTNTSDPMSSVYTRADAATEHERLNGVYFKKLANTITDSLIKDKKFLKHNSKFKEELYSVLKYGNMIDKSLRITYIPAEHIVTFGNGNSMIDRSLWFAKLYVCLLVTNVVVKLTRGYDKRVYYVKSDVPAELGNSINQAIGQIKKDSRSINMFNSVNRILNIAGQTPDMFIPVDSQGNKAIDMDVISGQDTQMKDELMEFLEDRMLSGTGTSTPLIQATTDVDFAKSLELLNIKYLRRTLSYQKQYNPSVNLLYNKINASDLGMKIEDDEYEVIPVELRAPSALSTQTMNEQVGNAKDLVDIIVRTYTDANEVDPMATGLFTQKLMKKFCPSIPHGAIDALYEESIKEAKLAKIENPGEDDSSGDGGY